MDAKSTARSLAEASGLDVQVDDVWQLARQGWVRCRSLCPSPGKRTWMFSVGDVEALASRYEVLSDIVAARPARIARLTDREAAEFLEWPLVLFRRVVGLLGMEPGPDERWSRADVDALANDHEVGACVADERIRMRVRGDEPVVSP
ncbi:hypothetical protein [Embleya sp. NBC_00896]|uniref:hypothetical protein n=1 Tax=Embleya sp. NBC_00896 TaxID=2975961 RepID=UPI002F91A0CB|nr:hypothetical protein OG928_47940 [Embleya sp. NBC_00896]